MHPLSIRLGDDLHSRLRAFAQRKAEPLSTVAQRAIREWLIAQDHSGLVFRDGPAGRRAGLVRGPDIWEVVAVLRDQAGSPDERISAAAAHMGLHRGDVELAATYWATHRDEVDAQVLPMRRPPIGSWLPGNGAGKCSALDRSASSLSASAARRDVPARRGGATARQGGEAKTTSASSSAIPGTFPVTPGASSGWCGPWRPSIGPCPPGWETSRFSGSCSLREYQLPRGCHQPCLMRRPRIRRSPSVASPRLRIRRTPPE